MPSFKGALLSLAASATMVLAHGHVREVVVGGTSYPGYERWANNQDVSKIVTWSFSTEDEGPVPIGKLAHPDIICHQDAANAQASVPIAPGEKMTVRRFNTIGGFEHPGPELHYLASCGDSTCDKVNKESLQFVKFYEKGLVTPGLPENQVWATSEVHKNVIKVDDGWIDEFTVTIPEDTPSGNYVLRHELFGLHRAHIQDAEFYPQCINIEVTGGNSGSLPQGTAATELYKANDAGIDLDIWVNLQSYQIPGPAVATSLSTAALRTTTGNSAAVRIAESKSHARDFRTKN